MSFEDTHAWEQAILPSDIPSEDDKRMVAIFARGDGDEHAEQAGINLRSAAVFGTLALANGVIAMKTEHGLTKAFTRILAVRSITESSRAFSNFLIYNQGPNSAQQNISRRLLYREYFKGIEERMTNDH